MKHKSPRFAILPGIVKAILLTWWLVIPSYALTVREIIAEARVLLNDNSADTTRQRFSDAQLLAFINDGQREANVLSAPIEVTYGGPLVGGTTEYALPSDFLASVRVTLDGKRIPQTSFNQLDADSPGWYLTRGKPTKYFINPRTTASGATIGFVPAPTTTSTGTYVIRYQQRATDVSNLDTEPWNTYNTFTSYHSALVYYAAYRGYMALLDDKIATMYFNEWTLYVNKMKETLLHQPDFNPGVTGQR